MSGKKPSQALRASSPRGGAKDGEAKKRKETYMLLCRSCAGKLRDPRYRRLCQMDDEPAWGRCMLCGPVHPGELKLCGLYEILPPLRKTRPQEGPQPRDTRAHHKGNWREGME